MAALPKRLAQIVEALERMDHGTPVQILDAIKARHADAPTLESIRARLQEHSSDSGQFKGKHDLFYSVEGIGKGIWGLRAADGLDPRNADGFLDDAETAFSDVEGKLVLRSHLRRERSERLVRKFKAQLAHCGCQACDFDFGIVYGQLASGYIEAHHANPLGERQAEAATSVNDLVALCSNCHRVLHLNPGLTHLELRAYLTTRKAGGR